jgi:hypothetical protein
MISARMPTTMTEVTNCLNTINIKFLVKLEKNTTDMTVNIQNTDFCVLTLLKYSVIMCVSTTLCLVQILNS